MTPAVEWKPPNALHSPLKSLSLSVPSAGLQLLNTCNMKYNLCGARLCRSFSILLKKHGSFSLLLCQSQTCLKVYRWDTRGQHHLWNKRCHKHMGIAHLSSTPLFWVCQRYWWNRNKFCQPLFGSSSWWCVCVCVYLSKTQRCCLNEQHDNSSDVFSSAAIMFHFVWRSESENKDFFLSTTPPDTVEEEDAVISLSAVALKDQNVKLQQWMFCSER